MFLENIVYFLWQVCECFFWAFHVFMFRFQINPSLTWFAGFTLRSNQETQPLLSSSSNCPRRMLDSTGENYFQFIAPCFLVFPWCWTVQIIFSLFSFSLLFTLNPSRCSAVYASNQQIQATVDISIFSESQSQPFDFSIINNKQKPVITDQLSIILSWDHMDRRPCQPVCKSQPRL